MLDAWSLQALAAAGTAIAGVSLLLVLALCLAVLGLKGQIRRLVDERGVLRRACLPKDLQTNKEKGAEGKDKQDDKHLTQLEAALREAAGAIQRHDKEMKKMIDRLQELESQQKGLEETMKTTNDSLLSPQKSFERDPRLMLATPLKSSSEVREVQEDREKSYLVGASVSQSVDLRTAQMSALGSDASARSLSQSNTPMGLFPPATSAATGKGSKDSVMSPIVSGGNTAETSPVPGPASVAASMRASADDSNDSGQTPAHPLGARASSDDSNRSGNKSYGPDLYGENKHASILFAGAPGSNASSHAGPETIMQDDMIVKADIGFSKNASAGSGGHSGFWAAMTDNINGMADNINLRTVPLLSLGQLSGSEDDARAKRQQEIQKEKKRDRERSLSRERRYARSQNSQPSSREPTPPRTPGKATPASLSAPSTPPMKGYTPVSSGGGLSARGTPHGHIHTALPSPHGSTTSNTSKSRRQVSSVHGHARPLSFPVADATGSSLVASGPLSARGINPERHPALHEKELAEMTRLVKHNCQDSAQVVSRTGIKCLWCHQIFMCPPYRPQSFYFKDIAGGAEHDGHYWCCPANPNVSLQAGKGVPVGDGKVLI